MFLHDRNKKIISLRGQSILTLSQSINRPMVAAGDFPAEETQAYMITIQAPDRALQTHIYLHLLKSNQCVIFSYDSTPFMGDRLEEVEIEAVDFVESMGFMMDNLNFNRLKPNERDVLYRDIPLFYNDLKDFEPILSEKLMAEESAEQEEEGLVGDPIEEVSNFEPLQPSILGSGVSFFEAAKPERVNAVVDANVAPPNQNIFDEPDVAVDEADPIDALVDNLDFAAPNIESSPGSKPFQTASAEAMDLPDGLVLDFDVDSPPLVAADVPVAAPEEPENSLISLFEPGDLPTAEPETPKSIEPVKPASGGAESDMLGELAALKSIEKSLDGSMAEEVEPQILLEAEESPALEKVGADVDQSGITEDELKEILGLLLSL